MSDYTSESIHGTTQFWGETKGNWQDFRWCPVYGTEEIHKNSEMCHACARRKVAKKEMEMADNIRYVRHLIHVWWTKTGKG